MEADCTGSFSPPSLSSHFLVKENFDAYEFMRNYESAESYRQWEEIFTVPLLAV